MSIQTSTSSILSHLIKANRFRAKHKYLEALDIYFKILEEMENSKLFSMISTCYFALASRNPNEIGDNYQKALNWLQRAVDLTPNDARLHVQLGELFELGFIDYEQAAAEYRLAIQINPNDVQALLGAASLWGVPENVVKLEEAISWLKSAVRSEPDNPHLWIRLATLYQDSSCYEDAILSLYQALLCTNHLDDETIRTIEHIQSKMART